MMKTVMTSNMVNNVANSNGFAMSVVSSSSNNSWSVSSNSNGKAHVLRGSLLI